MRTAVGDSTRYISIHIIANKMEQCSCHVSPAVNPLIGFYQANKIRTKQTALKASPDLYEYLRDFNVAINDLHSATDDADAYLTQERNDTEGHGPGLKPQVSSC